MSLNLPTYLGGYKSCCTRIWESMKLEKNVCSCFKLPLVRMSNNPCSLARLTTQLYGLQLFAILLLTHCDTAIIILLDISAQKVTRICLPMLKGKHLPQNVHIAPMKKLIASNDQIVNMHCKSSNQLLSLPDIVKT